MFVRMSLRQITAATNIFGLKFKKKIGKRQIVARCQEENKPNRELLKVSTSTGFCLILSSEFYFSSELSFKFLFKLI